MNKDDGKRRHIRVRDDIPVNWYIDRLGQSGKGILRNISISGAMLETKTQLTVDKDLLIMLKAAEFAESSFVPPIARLVWGRTAREGSGYFFYGMEFKDPSLAYSKAIQARVEDKAKSTQFGLGSGISDTSWNTR
ncbi:MAG: PilZ domain-containing protein [Candidatus Omnitrophota bacterium]